MTARSITPNPAADTEAARTARILRQQARIRRLRGKLTWEGDLAVLRTDG